MPVMPGQDFRSAAGAVGAGANRQMQQQAMMAEQAQQAAQMKQKMEMDAIQMQYQQQQDMLARQERAKQFDYQVAAKNAELMGKHGKGLTYREGKGGAPGKWEASDLGDDYEFSNEMKLQENMQAISSLWPEFFYQSPKEAEGMARSMDKDKLVAEVMKRKREEQEMTAIADAVTRKYPDIDPAWLSVAARTGEGYGDIIKEWEDGISKKQKDDALRIVSAARAGAQIGDPQAYQAALITLGLKDGDENGLDKITSEKFMRDMFDEDDDTKQWSKLVAVQTQNLASTYNKEARAKIEQDIEALNKKIEARKKLRSEGINRVRAFLPTLNNMMAVFGGGAPVAQAQGQLNPQQGGQQAPQAQQYGGQQPQQVTGEPSGTTGETRYDVQGLQRGEPTTGPQLLEYGKTPSERLRRGMMSKEGWTGTGGARLSGDDYDLGTQEQPVGQKQPQQDQGATDTSGIPSGPPMQSVDLWNIPTDADENKPVDFRKATDDVSYLLSPAMDPSIRGPIIEKIKKQAEAGNKNSQAMWEKLKGVISGAFKTANNAIPSETGTPTPDEIQKGLPDVVAGLGGVSPQAREEAISGLRQQKGAGSDVAGSTLDELKNRKFLIDKFDVPGKGPMSAKELAKHYYDTADPKVLGEMRYGPKPSQEEFYKEFSAELHKLWGEDTTDKPEEQAPHLKAFKEHFEGSQAERERAKNPEKRYDVEGSQRGEPTTGTAYMEVRGKKMGPEEVAKFVSEIRSAKTTATHPMDRSAIREIESLLSKPEWKDFKEAYDLAMSGKDGKNKVAQAKTRR